MTEYPQRKSPRLQDYDYTQAGAYFVTICTHDRKRIFGHIDDGEVVCNQMGDIVNEQWIQTGVLRDYVELDMFVVMPNHVHGILMIVESEEDRRGMMHHAPTTRKREFSKPIPRSLSSIIGTFKAAVTRHIRRLPNPPDHPIWQRNFHDHIIRNPDDLHRLREYVLYNPARWEADTFYET